MIDLQVSHRIRYRLGIAGQESRARYNDISWKLEGSEQKTSAIISFLLILFSLFIPLFPSGFPWSLVRSGTGLSILYNL